MPLFEFVWLSSFERSARKLLEEQDRREIEGILCDNLRAGSVLKRTGGVRKLRYAAETVTKDEERTLRRLARVLTQEPC